MISRDRARYDFIITRAVLYLPVTYKGEDFEYPLTVSPSTFGTRYIVDIDGVEVVYERDDSGDLRGLIRSQSQLNDKLPERELLEAIGAVLEKVLA